MKYSMTGDSYHREARSPRDRQPTPLEGVVSKEVSWYATTSARGKEGVGGGGKSEQKAQQMQTHKGGK